MGPGCVSSMATVCTERGLSSTEEQLSPDSSGMRTHGPAVCFFFLNWISKTGPQAPKDLILQCLCQGPYGLCAVTIRKPIRQETQQVQVRETK